MGSWGILFLIYEGSLYDGFWDFCMSEFRVAFFFHEHLARHLCSSCLVTSVSAGLARLESSGKTGDDCSHW